MIYYIMYIKRLFFSLDRRHVVQLHDHVYCSLNNSMRPEVCNVFKNALKSKRSLINSLRKKNVIIKNDRRFTVLGAIVYCP